MTLTRKYKLRVPPARSGVSDQYWKKQHTQYVQLWKAARSIIGCQTFEKDSTKYHISCDWGPIARSHVRYMKNMDSQVAMTAAYLEGKTRQLHFANFQRRPINLWIEVELNSASESTAAQSAASWVVDSYLYDVFLITNIAAPGACDFYKSVILQPGDDVKHKLLRETDLSLSNHLFDCSMLDAEEGKWPAPEYLGLRSVAQWYWTVRPGFSQTPTNDMEGVLFALLHLARGGISSTSVIWVFYALETLFGTRHGTNRRDLIERAALLLGCSSKQKSFLSKQVRTLYELRSSFVHGGMRAIHPLHNEMLDHTVESEYVKIAEALEFGFRLLLTSLQSVIKNGWKQPKFSENLVLSGDNVLGSP